MEIQLRELIANGFVIRPQGAEWVVEKIELPTSSWTVVPVICNSYEGAVNLAYSILEESRGKVSVQEFTVTVRYNRGLGIEYRNLSVLQAIDLKEAKKKAEEEAERLLGGPGVVIREVRVRPKG